MNLYYTDHFVLPLPPAHKFPMRKYAALRERVVAAGLVPPERLRVPAAATDEELLRAHCPDYLRRVVAGELTRPEILRMGFPWSPELVERSRRSSGATVEACRSALDHSFGGNLAGGTHHAFRDCGEGYCVFNDSIVAARALQAEGRVRRVVVLDCDVHQGNGTASIAADDETIFTFSIHGAKNFPARKETSDLDVPLPDGTADAEYLDALSRGIREAIQRSRADLAIYLAGADPYEHDRLGRLAVSQAGLAERDRLVFEFCRRAGLPVAVTMSGGYAPHIEDTVEIHFQTLRLGLKLLE